MKTITTLEQRLIAMGYEMDEIDHLITPRAYLHPTSDDCVTIDPTAYDKPRELVLVEDVVDHVEWIEKGIVEWRAAAVELMGENKLLRVQLEAAYALIEKLQS